MTLLLVHGSMELRGSLWLCFAGSLAEKRKSEFSGKWHRRKMIPWKNSLGKLREEEDEEGEPAIEQRREYTVFGFDLVEREKQVVCHASALVMTHEARQEAEM